MYNVISGLPVIPSADVASATSDANKEYPEGVGKRDGFFALRDTGSAKELIMANGNAPTDTWTKVGDGGGGDCTDVVTPA